MMGAGATQIVFDPVVPWGILASVAVVMAALLALAIWRGLAGWTARALAALVLLLALSGPSVQQEDRQTLADILLVVVDETASQTLSDRALQSEGALATLEAQVAARPDLELKVVPLSDAPDNRGSRLESAIASALGDVPRDRVAGVVAISDGLLHDAGTLAGGAPLPAPLHLLLTGRAQDWDRRLVIKSAPAFGILGEEQSVILRVEDLGAPPTDGSERVKLTISIDGAPASEHMVPIGRDLELPLTLQHGGMNVVQLVLEDADGELTNRNNSAIVQINGVRDRLRVLLVSGQPHPGTRTWRNLLKSDASVDLVHFTILRPPEKQDGVPVSELSLIAFPTQELFVDKIDEFDLIIFDRYELRGILPGQYLASVRDYVENGGAVLVAAGPAFATVGSIARSPLGPILPAVPTSRVSEAPFRPAVTDLGHRHPVTQGLTAAADPEWGRWLRQVEVLPVSGNVVMQGLDEQPLLVLDRVGKGRVALLASDHAWLWGRGYDGGGPQLELLRRLAHWMMKEPDLEEEALGAIAQGDQIRITRRSLETGDRSVNLTAPSGEVSVVPLQEMSPGLYAATLPASELGLYRLEDDSLKAVVALGPAAPREFVDTIASADALQPAIKPLRGGVFPLENGLPSLRNVRAGRPAAGRGWMGLTPRNAYLTTDIRLTRLLPGWLALLFAVSLTLWGWLREGRR